MVESKVKVGSKECSKLGFNKIFLNAGNELISVITIIIVFGFIIALSLPALSLLKYSGFTGLIDILKQEDTKNCILLSLQTSFLSLLLIFLLGTATVFYLHQIKNQVLYKILDILIEIPIVFPPAVAGLGLLMTFGQSGVIGRFANSYGFTIVFTQTAVVIAQLFVSSSYYIRIVSNALNEVPVELFEASYVFGAGKRKTMFFIIIPMIKKYIVSGLILAWIRALGEFGATMMFAGNVQGITRTIPLQIYSYMQTDLSKATALAALMYILSFTMLIFVRFITKEADQ
ncbi:ABC transporter permease [Clostridium manihotivorum]|uniref:Molybdate ABC transporter permease subunit n=1 Tax=Clostridium manihotivorum TaxID=2320868 RepID=A0A3R5QVK5_9CLOT|nr:ABC transporter permease [Clostridium manihotivorum]QAA33623.1 molybdate ABC transporter permease subunit [Clostridium manihotivorum]